MDVKVGLPHFSRRYTLYTNTCVYIHRSQHTYSRAHARALTHMCVSASHKSTRIKLACIRAHAHVPKHGRAHTITQNTRRFLYRKPVTIESPPTPMREAPPQNKNESVAIETAPTTASTRGALLEWRVGGRRYRRRLHRTGRGVNNSSERTTILQRR